MSFPHSHKRPLPALSDDLIRRFLLGRLSSTEQSIVEESLFIDGDVEDRVRLAELDLADDYAFARLNAPDRESFERKFLVSADRREALNVSRALHDRFGPTALIQWRAAIGAKVGLLFDFSRPVWRYAFAGLILALLMATAWLVIKEPRIALPVFTRRAPTNAKGPAKPQEAQHSAGAPSMPHQEPLPAQPVHREVGSTIVLRANDAAQAIDLSGNGHEIVHVQLMLERNDNGTYQSELLTIDGESVFSAEALKQSDAKIDFDIPARQLKRGEYQIKLSRFDNGAKSEVAKYYLRVR
jgi:hypothetical protein